MQQLEEIPFTELKIDRAFVNGASSNAESRAVIEASIQFGRKLKMEIVAEGVETREDWDLVEELGVDYVQGFFVAKPLPEDELQEFLNSWHPPPSRIKP
jgi:EAL domain-containing protein (putative c-di-GMP-specific phosphodiesterase class I)